MTEKGYLVPSGYMGWIGNRYILFPTEGEYHQWFQENIGD